MTSSLDGVVADTSKKAQTPPTQAELQNNQKPFVALMQQVITRIIAPNKSTFEAVPSEDTPASTIDKKVPVENLTSSEEKSPFENVDGTSREIPARFPLMTAQNKSEATPSEEIPFEATSSESFEETDESYLTTACDQSWTTPGVTSSELMSSLVESSVEATSTLMTFSNEATTLEATSKATPIFLMDMKFGDENMKIPKKLSRPRLYNPCPYLTSRKVTPSELTPSQMTSSSDDVIETSVEATSTLMTSQNGATLGATSESTSTSSMNILFVDENIKVFKKKSNLLGYECTYAKKLKKATPSETTSSLKTEVPPTQAELQKPSGYTFTIVSKKSISDSRSTSTISVDKKVSDENVTSYEVTSSEEASSETDKQSVENLPSFKTIFSHLMPSEMTSSRDTSVEAISEPTPSKATFSMDMKLKKRHVTSSGTSRQMTSLSDDVEAQAPPTQAVCQNKRTSEFMMTSSIEKPKTSDSPWQFFCRISAPNPPVVESSTINEAPTKKKPKLQNDDIIQILTTDLKDSVLPSGVTFRPALYPWSMRIWNPTRKYKPQDGTCMERFSKIAELIRARTMRNFIDQGFEMPPDTDLFVSFYPKQIERLHSWLKRNPNCTEKELEQIAIVIGIEAKIVNNKDVK